MVEVVCPRCATPFRAQPGAEADCPTCGFSGGRVPGQDGSYAYAAGMGSYTFQSQGFAPPGADVEKARAEAEKKAQKKAEEKTYSGAAVGSLVLGLLVFIPVAGIVAVALGIAGIAQTGKDKLKGRPMAVVGTLLGAVAQLVWFVAIVALFAAGGRLVNGG